MRLLKRIALPLVVIVILALALGHFCLNNPHLFAPGPYHPMSLHYKRKGIKVHPYLSLREDQYRLVVWETRWPLSWSGPLGFTDYMGYMAAGFQEAFPNVDIEFRYIRITDLQEALETALIDGSLPDVIAGPLDPGLVSLGLVPLDPFLDQQHRELYETNALEACSLQGTLVAWPRWFEVHSWTGNARLLTGLDVLDLARRGWTWREAEDVLKRVTADLPANEFPLLMDSSGAAVLEHLMAAGKMDLLVDLSGDFLWEGEPLLGVADFLGRLKSDGILPRDTSRMHDGLVADFMRGKVAVLAPAGPGLLRLWKETQPDTGVLELVLIPVPHPDDGEALVPATMNIIVALDKGDPARASLSARLALHLSRGPITWLTAEACGVPAYLPDRPDWRNQVGLPEPVLEFLEEAVKRSLVPSFTTMRHVRGEEVIMDRVIRPEVLRFWQGELDPAGLEEAIRHRVKGGGD